MMYKYRKKLQRGFNHIIRKINYFLVHDDVWRGRFTVRQINCKYYEYEDKSGGELFLTLRCLDRETGYYKDYTYNYFGYDRMDFGRINWDILNKFIVEDLEVWQQGCDPRKLTKTWTNEFEDRFEKHHWDYNWFVSYKYFKEEDYKWN